MNKITQILIPFLKTSDYRGLLLYQQSNLVNDLPLISDLFELVMQHDNFFPCREIDSSYIEFSNKYGWKTTVVRKTLLPDLEKMGLIKKKGKNWDFISLTESGLAFLNCKLEQREEEIEKAHRFRKKNDEKFSSFINRMKTLIEELGHLYWWEIWMCMRLDVDYIVVKNSIIEIRKKCKENRNQKIFIDEVTKLLNEHNVKGKKQNGAIDFHNILNKVTSFGIKAVFFHFSVSGKGRDIVYKSFFNSGSNKPVRTNKRSEFYLKNSEKKHFDYHHIIAFAHVKYNLNLQSLIDDDKNLLPILPEDHKKFPKKNNEFLSLKVEEGKLRFYSYENPKKFIEITNISHLELSKVESFGVSHNKMLIEKILKK
jgi:hypothetical protein